MTEINSNSYENTGAGSFPAANGFPEEKRTRKGGSGGDVIEIDLLAVLWLMLANWWKILIAGILGGAAAFAITFYCIQPSFTANSSIYIVSASKNAVIDISELQLGSSLSEDYLYLMTARPLMETVAQEVGQDQTWKSIEKSVTVSNSVGERIITIQATTHSPQLSADIANALATAACEFLPDVTGVETSPNVIETALVPTVKSSPSFAKNVLIGAFAGALLVCGILFISYLTNDTFLIGDDIASYYGMAPLAVIPEGSLGGSGRKKRRRRGSGYYSGYSRGYYGYGYGQSSENKTEAAAEPSKKSKTAKKKETAAKAAGKEEQGK